MKFLSKNNAIITILLLALLLVSSIFIVQLEIKASSLQSRLDEHHNELKNNSDVLDKLSMFMRKAGNNFILIDDQFLQLGTGKSTLQFKGDLFNVNLRSGKLLLELSEPDKLIQLINGDSKIKLNQDNIEIEAKDFSFYIDTRINDLLISYKNQIIFHIDADKKSLTLNNEKLDFLSDNMTINTKENIEFYVTDKIKFGYNKAEDKIYLINKDSKIFVGKLKNEGGKDIYGAVMTSKSRGQFQVREDGIIAGVPTQEGTYYFKMDSKKKYIEIVKGNSIIKFEGDNINIEADGDINISSKNGKVNINGKR